MDPRGLASSAEGTLTGISVYALALRTAALARREVAAAALLTGCLSGLLAALGPPAGDAPAHLYRSLLVREGVLVWDALWYGGHYPLASYSALYPFPAALLGDAALAVVACAAASGLFAHLSLSEWGEAARWPARAFAVVAAAPLFTGTYPYALGLAAALGALVALRARRRLLAAALAVATLGASPLAFLFLCIALAAVVAARRPPPRRVLPLAAPLAAAAGLQLGVVLVFPAEGRYPFRLTELLLAVALAALGTALASRSPTGRPLAAFFALWGLVCLVAFLVPSPFGSTVTRLRDVAVPLELLAAALAGFRPRLVAVAAVVAALNFNVGPYVIAATDLADARPAGAAFWRPALAFLEQRSSPRYRVDVVPTFDNWEAYHVAGAGVALTRGWYRQLDLARNPVLYGEELTGPEYRRWLRALGVRYVLLPHAPLDRLGAAPQAALLASGRSGLVEVLRTRDWTIYELPGATPILTGPGRAQLAELGRARVAGRVGRPGVYRLRVRYTPYLAVESGGVCLEPAADGMTRLVAARAGSFALSVPDPVTLLAIAVGARPAAC